ncbi:hypothetical protein ACQEVC_29650 [Plantactinospora sp. CA-294935]|uniref:hypothetical protein n=1 Tax=Plantactinospora sp. CA-294935 TaxID=3240012 RepID=UPI003D8DC7DD
MVRDIVGETSTGQRRWAASRAAEGLDGGLVLPPGAEFKQGGDGTAQQRFPRLAPLAGA